MESKKSKHVNFTLLDLKAPANPYAQRSDRRIRLHHAISYQTAPPPPPARARATALAALIGSHQLELLFNFHGLDLFWPFYCEHVLQINAIFFQTDMGGDLMFLTEDDTPCDKVRSLQDALKERRELTHQQRRKGGG